MTINDHQPSMWARERDDFLRAASGALLFGIPLLYTMEVWWRGNHTSPARMMAGLLITYVVLIVLNRTVGFRQERKDTSWQRLLTDSLETLATGLVVATLTLILLQRISLDVSLDAILGRIILEGIPFSIGAGIAMGLLGMGDGASSSQGGEAANGDGSEEEAAGNDSSAERGGGKKEGSGWSVKATLADAGSTALGALLVSFSIAPTDEVPLIATAMTPGWLLALVVVSLLFSYVIVFEADLGTQQARLQQEGLFQNPLSETFVSYLISLALCVLMLAFFQSLRVGDPWGQWLTYTLVLGLPATIGGAAGRLAL